MKSAALFMVLAVPTLLMAGENVAQYVEMAEKIKAETQLKEKAAQKKLIASLKNEEKNAQAAGNLDLVLVIRNRLGELEPGLEVNPLGEEAEVATTAHPIAGSPAEKAYADASALIQKDSQTKLKALIVQLTARKVALTKAGKIEDALLVDETIVDIAKSAHPSGTALVMGEVYIETNTRNGKEFFLFRPDQTYTYTAKGNKSVQRGKWKQEQGKTILNWDNQPSWGAVEITVQDTGALKLFRPTKNWTDEAVLATEADTASFKAEFALLKNDVPAVATAAAQPPVFKLTREAAPFVGVWVREGSGTQFNFAADGSVEKLTNKGGSGNTDYDKGTWRVERNEVIAEFQKGIAVRFRPKIDGTMDAPATLGSAGDWKVKKKQ